MDKMDIIIIGGGPAGLSTALHLVKDDPGLASRILVLEKEGYPRHKTCAGGLVVDAERILKKLDLNVGDIPHVNVDIAHFHFKGKGLNLDIAKQKSIRVIRRDQFDAWLAQHTSSRGVEIRQHTKVRHVQTEEHGISVETDQGTLWAKVVVGADGSNGISRRCILPLEPLQTSRTLEILTEPISTTEPNKKQEAFFDFLPIPDHLAGYIWDFPTQIEGTPMRCQGIYDYNLFPRHKRTPLKQLLMDELSCRGFKLEGGKIESHPIRLYEPGAKISVPGILWVGDAAGSDPLFGEGISLALGYGAVAAQEIGKALNSGDFSFKNYSSSIAKSGLGQTLFARWLIANFFYRIRWGWFHHFLWSKMKPIVILISCIFVMNWSEKLK